MVSTEEHDRCVLELRKIEQRNKRRRERNADAWREQQIQFQHHASNSHVAAAEKRLLCNRQRREVTAKKKELHEQEYVRIEGGVSLQNKRSRRLVQLASSRGVVVDCSIEGSIDNGNDIVDQRIQLAGEHFTSTGYDTIVDGCTVENELSARCEGMVFEYFTHQSLSTPLADWSLTISTLNIQRYIMAFQPKLIPDISLGQTSWIAKVVVAKKNISRTAQRSPVKYQNLVLVDQHAYIQVQDSTGCIDTTMTGETVEAFWQSTADILMQLTTQEDQSVTQSIRTSIDDEHILYVRATERNVNGIQVKYDVVFLIDSVTELDTPMRPKTHLDVVFTFRDSDISQDEEHGGLTGSSIPSQLGESIDHSVVDDFSKEDDIPVQQQYPGLMAHMYKSILDVGVQQGQWTSKVIVAKKSVPKKSQLTRLTYQNFVFIDLQENKVQCTIYNNDITAFQNTLIWSNTYLILNAAMKLTDPRNKVTLGPTQWTINGRTKVQLIEEDNQALLFLTYNLVLFRDLQQHIDMDSELGTLAVRHVLHTLDQYFSSRSLDKYFFASKCMANISDIVAVVIDVLPKKVVQTKYQSESCI
ncbi:replication protein A 70 kDa DNA-binding subunit B-like [Forsythia ovata]|uniref:Replication protein A 70 kDa DNA-binding subunit B-like n=1 Tax=Forsythia ovata TaxID=205694 RepID=A0ABD1S4W4_9LAMI